MLRFKFQRERIVSASSLGLPTAVYHVVDLFLQLSLSLMSSPYLHCSWSFLPSPTLRSWVVRSSHIPSLFNSERVFLSFSVYLLICLLVHFRFSALILCRVCHIPSSIRFIYTFWLSFHLATKTFIEHLF